VRGRFTYGVPKKFDINGSAGVEFRQFGPLGRANFSAPIAELAVTFESIEGTKLFANARYRTYVSNALLGQDFRVTACGGGLEQRLSERLNFRVVTGYEMAELLQHADGGRGRT